ncbi:hypothetical protein QQF64_033870 [Cirrhinus molitorella]|uniref:Uncharacterized protein n=1 Tax=Cirrhinus molitorella TaxID=172907 RepID=A0ABR3MV79_9TELE
MYRCVLNLALQGINTSHPSSFGMERDTQRRNGIKYNASSFTSHPNHCYQVRLLHSLGDLRLCSALEKWVLYIQEPLKVEEVLKRKAVEANPVALHMRFSPQIALFHHPTRPRRTRRERKQRKVQKAKVFLPEHVIGRYKKVLRYLVKGATKTEAYHKCGVDGKTIVDACAIAELEACDITAYNKLRATFQKGQKLSDFAVRC